MRSADHPDRGQDRAARAVLAVFLSRPWAARDPNCRLNPTHTCRQAHAARSAPARPLRRDIAMRATPRQPRHSAARTDTTPTQSPPLDLAGNAQLRHLEKMGPWTRHERLRFLWYRLRLAVREMNYATSRLAELQQRLP